jgi:glycosyltransferase involved in cell wall biosynthesis/Flp pilus assembly protein TadD
MGRRYLFGPVTAHFADQNLRRQRERGDCLTFDQAGAGGLAIGPNDSWETICSRLPAGWEPDFIVLYMAYTTVPQALWSAPVPLVGLAMDWNLLWHFNRRALGLCDLILADSLGVEVLGREGIGPALRANLFGCQRAFLETEPTPANRDLDILFVGNLNPAIQRERLPWLERLARLGERWRVAIHCNVFGDAYRQLLRRARIVFNRSIRGECNLRVFEAISAGALLFQEVANREVGAYLRPGEEYIAYTENDLEKLLNHYLEQEDERRTIAEAARARVQDFSFENLWDEIVEQIEEGLEARGEGRGTRDEQADPRCSMPDLIGRTWQALGSSQGTDPALLTDLEQALNHRPNDAALHNAMGLVVAMANQANGRIVAAAATRAAWHFRHAFDADPPLVPAGLNLAEALTTVGQTAEAIHAARRTLAALERRGELDGNALDAGHFPPTFDLFRVEWERAAWLNAGDRAAEARAKRQLLRWRLHTLLAALTSDMDHFYEAVVARPDLPSSRAALGCALARAGRVAQAVPHLQEALADNPFDVPASKALFQAVGDSGDVLGQRRFGARRRLLAQAAPMIPAEPWMMNLPPTGDELASIIIPCCNELDYTKLCVESVLRHSREPFELIFVDNGSIDGTAAYLQEMRDRNGSARAVIIRNDSNRGFAAACNQAVACARGTYVVFLNNDTVVTSGWLARMIAWALRDWPRVGLVGPMSNYAPPPQRAVNDYPTLDAMEAFAANHCRAHAGKGMRVERLTGFCLLARREVLHQVGGFDERFGSGFFEDDDLCLRAAQAGFQLILAQDVFVHHFGSRTFKGLGIDGREQLKKNLEQFREKWGDERAARYQLPEETDGSPGERSSCRSAATVEDRRSTIEDRENPRGRGRLALADAPSAMRVSLCMIVKNEQDNLRPCLQSVADLVDEMIVVDTGSTDRTKEIAAELGARVYELPWPDSFSAARNESCRHATGDWIFWLDADDRVDEANRQKLRTLFACLRDENVAYSMKCVCLPDTPGGAATVVDHVRLFRNRPDIRWEYRVHEQILPAIRRTGGDAREADVAIQHTGYQDSGWRQTKDHRNLRLLELDHSDDPNNPFTLFNLGWTYEEMKRPGEALPLLRRSLELSAPTDSIVRKLYSLIMECHRQLGQPQQALAACREGRQYYPDDAQLLFQEAILRREAGDRPGAEACLLHLLGTQERPHFASVVEGLRGHKARHNLAVIYHEQGRSAEAEAQWLAAIREEPAFLPAWIGLGELYLSRGQLKELVPIVERLLCNGAAELPATATLRARAHLARREFAEAREVLQGAIRRQPNDLVPRVLLSHALLQEGADFDAAEQALRDVLDLCPDHAEATSNLAVLVQQRAATHAARIEDRRARIEKDETTLAKVGDVP